MGRDEKEEARKRVRGRREGRRKERLEQVKRINVKGCNLSYSLRF